MRDRGIMVSWTVVHGRPDEAIAARAAKSKSFLILFGLHSGGNQATDCADGVVSSTIREALSSNDSAFQLLGLMPIQQAIRMSGGSV